MKKQERTFLAVLISIVVLCILVDVQIYSHYTIFGAIALPVSAFLCVRLWIFVLKRKR